MYNNFWEDWDFDSNLNDLAYTQQVQPISQTSFDKNSNANTDADASENNNALVQNHAVNIEKFQYHNRALGRKASQLLGKRKNPEDDNFEAQEEERQVKRFKVDNIDWHSKQDGDYTPEDRSGYTLEVISQSNAKVVVDLTQNDDIGKEEKLMSDSFKADSTYLSDIDKEKIVHKVRSNPKRKAASKKKESEKLDISYDASNIISIQEKLFNEFIKIISEFAANCFEAKAPCNNVFSDIKLFSDAECDHIMTNFNAACQLSPEENQHTSNLPNINRDNLLKVQVCKSGQNLLHHFLKEFAQQKAEKKYESIYLTYLIVKFLLDIWRDAKGNKIPQYCCDQEGKSLVAYACETGEWSIVKKAIGSIKTALNKVYIGHGKYTTALHILCDQNFVHCAKKIVEIHNPLRYVKDQNGYDIAEYAILKNNLSFQKLLIVQDSHSENKNLIFHLCSKGDIYKKQLTSLIELYPYSVKLQDENDRLPLHYACESGAFELVKILLGQGSCVDQRDKAGKKPEDLAKEKMVDYHRLESSCTYQALRVYSDIIGSYRKIINHLHRYSKNNTTIDSSASVVSKMMKTQEKEFGIV